jgi:predicted transcriptional regulator
MMQFTLKYNPENTGLKTLFREWQITTLKLLWESPHTRFSTKDVWTHVKDHAEIGVSRATVYHFLDNVADKGIISFDMASGRGGMRVLFYSKLTEMAFRKLISENLVQSVKSNLGDVSP